MSDPHDTSGAISRALKTLHTTTDRRFLATTAAIGSPIGCGPGCFACCVDELTVWEVEADRIQAWVNAARADGRTLALKPAPAGRCAFLDPDGRCRVYPARPYVCRSQGAVLRWWHESDDGAETEQRDTCPEHLAAVSLGDLPDSALFDLGPGEQRLAELATQALAQLGEALLPAQLSRRALPQRVGLRDLAVALHLAASTAP